MPLNCILKIIKNPQNVNDASKLSGLGKRQILQQSHATLTSQVKNQKDKCKLQMRCLNNYLQLAMFTPVLVMPNFTKIIKMLVNSISIQQANASMMMSTQYMPSSVPRIVGINFMLHAHCTSNIKIHSTCKTHTPCYNHINSRMSCAW